MTAREYSLVDFLERIQSEWEAVRENWDVGCRCDRDDPHSSCPPCEIEALLGEALDEYDAL